MKAAQLSSVVMSLIMAVTVAGLADVPELGNYQGRLADSLGFAVTDTVDLTFKIYGSSGGSDVLWEETHTDVIVVYGLFDVVLGQGNPPQPLPDSIFSASETWLAVSVDGGAELSPRTRLVSVPYSHRVSTIDQARGGTLQSLLIVKGDSSDSVVISPNDDIVLQGTTDQGDEVVLITAGQTGAQILVTSSDAAKGPDAVGRRVQIAPDQNVVLRATEANDDDVVLITAGEDGGSMVITSSDAAKALQRSVTISPAENVVLKATEANQDDVVLITAGDDGGSLVITSSDAAKADPNEVIGAILVNKDGFFIVDETGSDTSLALLANGDVVTDGQVAMGEDNEATGDSSTVSGGFDNSAGGEAATVSGGGENTASGNYSTVGGGFQNLAEGQYSTIPGGYQNQARGIHSTAIGNQAVVAHDGSVVISASDNSLPDSAVSTTEEQILLRADGGFVLTDGSGCDDDKVGVSFLLTSTGAYLSEGGVWANASDASLKENFADIDREEILERLAALPIQRWNYIRESSEAQHIGPTAQDFYEQFGLGDDDKTISTIDPAGVALAAIQALHAKTEQLESRTREVEQMQKEIAELKALLNQLINDQEQR
jgi:hypothetical protein